MQPLVSTVADGCVIVALQQPQASHAAMAVQFSRGSHDEPPRWPGLAHFFEHLVFLGGRRFSGDSRLMPYVQSCGGQINASTGATTTDYFFETPPSHFEGAAERLLDMLVEPCLALEDQRREREVIQAEYLARAADVGQLGQSALMAVMGSGHPLGGFHAGNRSTLAVEDPQFQQALHAFHDEGYRAGYCRIALVGPQSAEALLALGRRWAQALPKGAARLHTNTALAPVSPGAWQLCVQAQVPRLWLGLHLADQSPGFAAAVDALAVGIGSHLPQGLLDQLVRHGLALDLRVHRLYDATDEALIGVEIELADESAWVNARAAVEGWLRFWGKQLPHGSVIPLFDKPLGSMTALQAARSCLRASATSGEWLDEAGRASLQRLLAGIDRLPAVVASRSACGAPAEVCGFPVEMAPLEAPPLQAPISFSKLPTNPLADRSPEIAPAEQPDGLEWLPRKSSEAALFLRWEWGASDQRPRGVTRLGLRGLMAAADQSGLTLALEECPPGFLVRCAGDADRLPELVWHLGRTLNAPYPPLALPEPDEMPIRRLLRVLPDHLQAPTGLSSPTSRWHGLLVGMQEPAMRRVSGALGTLPGSPAPGGSSMSAAHPQGARLVLCDGPDAAVVLFFPVLDCQASTEAAWRVLGQWLPARFYQRMRGELQLGYGVFCGFRQFAGMAGLLFAIESPNASCNELIAHIGDFLHQQLAAFEREEEGLFLLLEMISSRLDAEIETIVGEGELIWQAHLAGQPLNHPASVRAAIATLSREALRQALAALAHVDSAPLTLRTHA